MPESPPVSDRLDHLANDLFAGRVVRKDLVRQVKVDANVPVYVLEFLLGKYCASDDPAAVATGLQVVNQTLHENFIRPDEAEKAKAEVKRKGKHRLIDKVDVRLVATEDKFWAHLASFGEKHVHIPLELVHRYERLLGGGVWSQLDLVYNADDDEPVKRPFFIAALKPIQIAAFDLNDYVEGRRQLSRDDWLDLVTRSVGLEPAELDLRTKLLACVRLIPSPCRAQGLRVRWRLDPDTRTRHRPGRPQEEWARPVRRQPPAPWAHRHLPERFMSVRASTATSRTSSGSDSPSAAWTTALAFS